MYYLRAPHLDNLALSSSTLQRPTNSPVEERGGKLSRVQGFFAWAPNDNVVLFGADMNNSCLQKNIERLAETDLKRITGSAATSQPVKTAAPRSLCTPLAKQSCRKASGSHQAERRRVASTQLLVVRSPKHPKNRVFIFLRSFSNIWHLRCLQHSRSPIM